MTDLPAAQRDELAAASPRRCWGCSRRRCDGGTPSSRSGGSSTARWSSRWSMRYPGRATRVRLQPGRLRHGVPLLRHRAGRPHPQPVRPARSSTGVAAARSLAREEVGGGPVRVVATWSSWAWGSRWPTTTAVIGAVRRLTDPSPAGLGCRPAGHRLHRRPGARDRPAGRRGHAGDPGADAARPDDELRDELVPINTRFSVAETVEAAWDYAGATRRGCPSSTP